MDQKDHFENNNEQQSDDSEDSDNWIEEKNTFEFSCIFCSYSLKDIKEAVTHCKNEHKFDFSQLILYFKMDCYSIIKLINFIRSKQSPPEEIMKMKFPLWSDEKFLTPVIENDPWLMLDYDELDIVTEYNIEQTQLPEIENGTIRINELHYLELHEKIDSLKKEIEKKDESLQRLTEDLKSIQKFTRNFVEGSENETFTRSLEDDEGYFNSYAHYSIHFEMLSDDVRTSSYRNAILNNKEIFKDKYILDVGCGTSILSMFAASAGAKLVIGVDQSDIIYNAMDIIRENKLENKINLIKGRLEDTNLPIEKFDIIISEWMGYFLLYEGMLASIIYARDNYLKNGGILMPNKCTVNLVGLADKALYASKVEYWSNVYDYKMSCLQNEVIKEPSVAIVNPDEVFTTSSTIHKLDLNTCTLQNLHMHSTFILEALRDDTLTAIVGYFDVDFSLPNSVSFSTSPKEKPTHWKQTIFFLKKPIHLKQGEQIKGEIVSTLCNKRCLRVIIKIQNEEYKYKLY